MHGFRDKEFSFHKEEKAQGLANTFLRNVLDLEPAYQAKIAAEERQRLFIRESTEIKNRLERRAPYWLLGNFNNTS